MRALVITARGLQAGAVGAYGNTRLDTPALDRLRGEARGETTCQEAVRRRW
jgi:hypothetical protein